jgi:hypothetical protein
VTHGKAVPRIIPGEQEEADNEHSPARATGSTFLLSLLWRLSDAAFADRARGQWKCDTASSGGPEGNGHVRHSVYSSPGGNRHVGDTASFAAPDGNGHIDVYGMSRGVRYSGQACRISAYYDLLVCDFDGARNRDGNPRVAVRTRWTETQGHPAVVPGTGTARTEAMQ